MSLAPGRVRLLLAVALLIAWEAAPRLGLIPTLFLPPFTETMVALWTSGPEYLRHLMLSAKAILIAGTIACGAGILLGLLVGSIRPVARFLQPIAAGAYAVPLVILYPLFTAWMGIGIQSKIAFAALYGFLPCLLGMIAGAQTIDRHHLVVARSFGATRLQTVARVLLPAAIPTVLSSLRVGGSLVIVGVIVAEMLTSAEGVGYLITKNRTLLDSPRVFAGILIVIFLVLAFDRAVRLLEHRTRFWRLSTQSAGIA
jgi:NitT/TauT family transport system permease protein